MTNQYPAAVLWDMDGTIIDTEPAWIAAETELVESFGGSWSRDNGEQLIGFGLSATARLLQTRGVALEEDEIVYRLTTSVVALLTGSLPWRPGALELMRELREAGIKQALVTMSMIRMAEHVAKAIGFDAFDVIVAGDQVKNSKPDPECYVRAAELLGVDPAHCVAIEDSAPGLAAAVGAGAIAIGVPHHAQPAETSGYVLWPTLVGRGIGDISAQYLHRLENPESAVVDS